MAVRVLIPNGAIGLGFDQKALDRGVAMAPDIICVDGGSTDSGPYYLGTGTSKYSRASTMSEWRALMKARAAAGVPLVVGTAGTCGTDATVDWMYEITTDLAAELGQSVRIARIYSSQTPQGVTSALRAGRVKPLAPMGPLDADTLESCENIVALAGAEQINAALDAGADIVLAGRTTDTATIAALPIKRGAHAGAAWHAAKIGECGALCSSNPTSGVIILDIDETGFTVTPMAEGAVATPHSVSAHMLYENADPFILHEPGGHLDVTAATYTQLDDVRVRVTGSEWVPGPYSVKLEGARIRGYQTVTLVLLREARYVKNARAWTKRLAGFLADEIQSRMGLAPDQYGMEFRIIGQDATLGDMERKPGNPAEVGVMGIVTATSQAQAGEIAKLINPFMLHYPLTDEEPQATFAFPFSPAEMSRGPLYEFCLNHVLLPETASAPFRMQVDDISHGARI